MIILSGRDFGPMLKAERNARASSMTQGESSQVMPQEAHIIDALLPLLVLILGTIVGLACTGYDATVWSANTGFFSKVHATVGMANSYKALLWASVWSLLTAIVMTLIRGKIPSPS